MPKSTPSTGEPPAEAGLHSHELEQAALQVAACLQQHHRGVVGVRHEFTHYDDARYPSRGWDSRIKGIHGPEP